MTSRAFQMAMLVEFAVRQCGRSDRKKGLSHDELRAVCFCMRERVRAGWDDADWVKTIEYAPNATAHYPDTDYVLDPNDRALQKLLAEIEDVFYGRELATFDGMPGLEHTIAEHGCKYWCWLDRKKKVDFERDIMGDQENHPQMAQMGLMLFFG